MHFPDSYSHIALIVLLKVFYLFHYLAENLGAVLRWVSIFDQAYLNIKFQLIPHDLIIQPIGK